jgi:hypothetical protein
MKQKTEVWLAGALLVLSILGWPISALTFAKGEPPTVLGLSWFAITLTAADYFKNARAHKDQEEDQ